VDDDLDVKDIDAELDLEQERRGHNFEILKERISGQSKNKLWNMVKKEWQVATIHIQAGATCICSKKNLKNVFKIENLYSKQRVDVGIVCVENFLGDLLGASALTLFACLRALQNGAVRPSIIPVSKARGFITKGEADFLQETKRKKLKGKQIGGKKQILDKLNMLLEEVVGRGLVHALGAFEPHGHAHECAGRRQRAAVDRADNPVRPAQSRHWNSSNHLIVAPQPGQTSDVNEWANGPCSFVITKESSLSFTSTQLAMVSCFLRC